jgi:hypothetical protein
MKKLARIAFFISLVMVVSAPAFAVTLTSLTMEKSTSTGEWLNLPGGIWSTNTADILTQLGVQKNGTFVNTTDGVNLGEISTNLTPGVNTFYLFGTSWYGGSDYYGIALFFDNKATPPQMAVFNSNGSAGPFTVTPAGTKIAGSANGGEFPDVAPGSSTYIAPNGDKVELVAFNAVYLEFLPDFVSWGNIGADGFPDTYALLKLDYTPVPVPPSMLLLGSGLLALLGLRKRLTGR